MMRQFAQRDFHRFQAYQFSWQIAHAGHVSFRGLESG
jgi:hypothetical protein